MIVHGKHCPDPAVLVIEDDPVWRALLVTTISAAGWQVVGAADGQDALDWLHCVETPPDVIVLDLFLPRLNGWEFLLSLRQNPQWQQIPVCVVSAVADHQLQLGVSAYLVKPVSPTLVLETVRRCYLPGS